MLLCSFSCCLSSFWCSGVHCCAVVSFAVLWYSLLSCGVHCRDVVFIVLWLLLYSYGVHCRAVVFIPVLWYSPCSGVHCSSVVFITVLWCSLLCCGIRCRAVVFITVMWCSCRVHYCIVAFIAVLLCSAPYCGAVLRFSFHCYGVQNTAEFSVDIIGQRYARKETGQRNGHHYSIFYLNYYAAVCSV